MERLKAEHLQSLPLASRTPKDRAGDALTQKRQMGNARGDSRRCPCGGDIRRCPRECDRTIAAMIYVITPRSARLPVVNDASDEMSFRANTINDWSRHSAMLPPGQ